MAIVHCGRCNSTDTQAGLDRVQCLNCGATTPYPGTDAAEVGVQVPGSTGGMTTTEDVYVAAKADPPKKSGGKKG